MPSKTKNFVEEEEKWMLPSVCVLTAIIYMSERLVNNTTSRQFNESEWMDLSTSCFFPLLPTSLSLARVMNC